MKYRQVRKEIKHIFNLVRSNALIVDITCESGYVRSIVRISNTYREMPRYDNTNEELLDIAFSQAMTRNLSDEINDCIDILKKRKENPVYVTVGFTGYFNPWEYNCNHKQMQDMLKRKIDLYIENHTIGKVTREDINELLDGSLVERIQQINELLDTAKHSYKLAYQRTSTTINEPKQEKVKDVELCIPFACNYAIQQYSAEQIAEQLARATREALCTTSPIYPIMLCDTTFDLVVLFTSYGVGTVVKPNSHHSIGEHRTDWAMDCFRTIDYSIMLKNKEN